MDLAKLNIRVNGILPGSIETPASYNHMRKINLSIEEGRKAFAEASLWNRQGAPQEVANAAAFLASDEASFMTGSFMTVDAGWTIGNPAEDPVEEVVEDSNETKPIEFFDPHLHIWDLTDKGPHD